MSNSAVARGTPASLVDARRMRIILAGDFIPQKSLEHASGLNRIASSA
jgi:hypothetical protein